MKEFLWYQFDSCLVLSQKVAVEGKLELNDAQSTEMPRYYAQYIKDRLTCVGSIKSGKN